MPKRIYISSTFRDLENYRDKAIDTLHSLKNFFEVVTTMEEMVPGSDQPPLDQCLGFVRSCDIYLLIIGKFYGSTPKGDSKSFTHQEYDLAYTMGKIIIPLFADDEAQGIENVESVTPAEKDSFMAFKNTILQRHVRFNKTFTNQDMMASQMLMSLLGLAQIKLDIKPLTTRCDREKQLQTFVARKRQNQLNVFLMACEEKDLPDAFVERVAINTFKCSRESLNKIYTTNIIESASEGEFACRLFITHLLMPFLDPGVEDMPDDFSAAIKKLKSLGINRLFQPFYIDPVEVKDSDIIVVLRNMLEIMKAACANNSFTFILTFIFKRDDGAICDLQAIKDFASVYDTSILVDPLSKINKDEMSTWLRKYVTSYDNDILRLSNMMYPSNIEYYMSEFCDKVTEDPIEKEIEKILKIN